MKHFTSMKTIRNLTCAVALSTACIVPGISYAATPSAEDIDAQIQAQQKILAELNTKKSTAENQRLAKQMDDLSQQITELKNRKNYDAKGAIEALATQLADLQDQMRDQDANQEKLVDAIDKLNKLTAEQKKQETTLRSSGYNYQQTYSGPTSGYLVNPGPNRTVGYTQDAQNAQGNSTMVFCYAENQLYKIYCRTGYLTDIALHKGEKVNFVGGGDTSAWKLSSTTVDGTPHIYIKPVVAANTTNLIITTDKRSYQLIVTTSDWYNPMVRWTYDKEDDQNMLLQQKKDAETITSSMSATSMEKLHFDYDIKVKGDKKYQPATVFDDGEKTVIKFKKMPKVLPALFIKERGHKSVSLANFKQKDDCYLLDRLVSTAELRFSDSDIVTISRK